MGLTLGDAILWLRGDDSKLKDDLARAEGHSKSWAESLGSGISGTIGGAMQALGAAAVGAAVGGIAAVGTGLAFAVSEASEAQQNLAQLDAVLKSTGGAAGVTREQAIGLANSLSGITKFSDDAVMAGESLLLTFTGIGQDVFPDVTKTMLDMSQAMGQDVKSSAMQLGKALNDPTAGVTALTRVGVVFTEEQKKLIASLQESGDVAGAQKIILAELNKEFGGSAEAAGNTFAGKMAIAQNVLGNLGETIGTALLPTLTDLVGKFSEWVTAIMPQVEAMLPVVTAWLGENLPVAVQFLSDLWTNTLQPALTQVWEFVETSVIPMLVTVWDWLSVNLPPAIQGLSDFWTNTLQPALQTVWEFVETSVIPMLQKVWDWMSVNLPPVIQALSDLWTGTLQPALSMFWDFVQANLLPILQQIWDWLSVNLPPVIEAIADMWVNNFLAGIENFSNFVNDVLIPVFQTVWDWISTNLPPVIQALSDLWTGTLQPALTAVGTYLSETFTPLFEALKTLFDVGMTLALTALTGLWEKTLQPALKVVGDYVKDKLQPVFEALSKFWSETFGPALDGVKTNTLDKLAGVFEGIRNAVGWAVDKIKDLTTALSNVVLPSWMTPGSPTPWEIGLVGINKQLEDLAGKQLVNLQSNLAAMTGNLGMGGETVYNTYNLTAQYGYATQGTLEQRIAMLQMMG